MTRRAIAITCLVVALAGVGLFPHAGPAETYTVVAP